MNRRERRAQRSNVGFTVGAGSKGWFEGKGKAQIVLHTEPTEENQTQLAVLLTALGYSYTVSSKLPDVTWPVHVAVDFGGIMMCGTVEPADGKGGEPIIDPNVH